MKLRLNAWHTRLASLCNVHKRFSMILYFSSYQIYFLMLQMWHSGEKLRNDCFFWDFWEPLASIQLLTNDNLKTGARRWNSLSLLDSIFDRKINKSLRTSRVHRCINAYIMANDSLVQSLPNLNVFQRP